MIYKTITVTPKLIGNAITASANLADDAIPVTAEIFGDLAASADLTDNVILVSAAISQNITVDARLTTVISAGSYDYYTGPYSVTPTTQTQTLQTAAKALTRNITIDPIPSNYGLITWNGLTLTVS